MAQGRDVQAGITGGSLSMDRAACEHDGKRISVRVDQVLPWLANAAEHGFAWLQDFEDEEICITSDLHDVILAYQQFHHR